MYPAIPSFVGFAKALWNKGRLIGQKRPLRPKDVWAIRVRLQLEGRRRDLALHRREPAVPHGARSSASSFTSDAARLGA
jgi:hypothetical protein